MKGKLILVFFLLAVSQEAPAQSRKGQEPRGKTGIFDYYLLSLSWSPQYCVQAKGTANEAQCAQGRRFGFVVHGLWPQYERGWPQFCARTDAVPSTLVQRMLPLMPSAQLIEHEWQKHGTCSGLGQEGYFRAIEQLRRQLRIPVEFQAPVRQVQTTLQEIKKKFTEANPTLRGSSIRVLCSGRFLSEVRLCYDREMNPRSCSSDVRDNCRADPIIMQPVR